MAKRVSRPVAKPVQDEDRPDDRPAQREAIRLAILRHGVDTAEAGALLRDIDNIVWGSSTEG